MKRLSQLLASFPHERILRGLENVSRTDTANILGVTQDSQQGSPHWIFVAIRGHQKDGHKYLNDVCAQGVSAIVVEDLSSVPRSYSGVVVQTKDSRKALELLSACFFEQPSEKLFCVGVTGTNGKTSTSYLCEQILNAFGWETGVMGTINHHFKNQIWNSQLTTPDPITLQGRLAEFVRLGARAAVFEVSSHALEQHRVDEISFDVAIFTNLTRDHLDYHETMEKYFLSKQNLFQTVLSRSQKKTLWAIVNGDDEWAGKLKFAPRAQVWRYGRQNDCDLQFRILNQSFQGVDFLLRTPQGEHFFNLPLLGTHNVYNATAAIAVGLIAGASLSQCEEALRTFKGVPGRLEKVVDHHGNRQIFVDYAHTDDALKSVLNELSQIRMVSREAKPQGKIITVFGCGGDRDQGKRPLMTQAALCYSDLVFITSDNPRSEDPHKIILDCLKAVPHELSDKKVFTEVDRRLAIGKALQMAEDGDVILIAGKGHENYQMIGSQKFPFSDVEVIQSWLHSKSSKQEIGQ